MKYENDKRDLKFGHSTAISDPEVINYIKNFNTDFYTILSTDSKEYTEIFLNWIRSSKNNLLYGLDKFKYAVYSNGTTEGFEKFYWNNQHKRFRCFKGEYLYHKLAWRNYNWDFIEDDDLKFGDAVVISLPFADTGSMHPQMDFVLKKCTEFKIPVLIDACYFGISKGIIYNFHHECITDITFSLSKVFPVAHARIGLRLTKEDTDDLLFVYQKHSYNNRLGAELGVYLMKKFSPDYIYDKYREKQEKFCSVLGVNPSDTVIFGIGDSNWNEYNRGTATNRLGFQKYFQMTMDNFEKDNET